jgi:alpha-tubulin suppressor-like RCC1 family protein
MHDDQFVFSQLLCLALWATKKSNQAVSNDLKQLLCCLCHALQLPSLHHVQQLCLGFSHSMAIGRYGDVHTWGTDEQGSLGQGFRWPKPGSMTPEHLPVRLQQGAAGWKHTAGEVQ